MRTWWHFRTDREPLGTHASVLTTGWSETEAHRSLQTSNPAFDFIESPRLRPLEMGI